MRNFRIVKKLASGVLAGIVLAAVSVTLGCPGQIAVPDEFGAVDPRPAPDFTLPDIDGRAVSLSDHAGKVVLIDFWATWCAPCRKEMPVFQALQDRFRDKGFEVIAISLDENAEDLVPPYVKELGVNFTNLLGNDHVEEMYGPIEGIPTFFLVDRKGQIRRKATGTLPEEAIEGWINELL